MKLSKYADVVVAGVGVDRAFQYAIPEALAARVSRGARVAAPFGGRVAEGFVVGLSDTPSCDAAKIKEILDAPDDFNLFTPYTLALAEWMAETYDTPLAVCLQCVMPTGVGLRDDFAVHLTAGADGSALKGVPRRVFDFLSEVGGATSGTLDEQFGKPGRTAVNRLAALGLAEIRHEFDVRDYARRVKRVTLNDAAPDFDALAADIYARGGKQAEVLRLLARQGDTNLADVKALLRITDSPVKTLERRGLLLIETVTVARDVLDTADTAPPEPIVYTDEQRVTIDRLTAALDAPARKPFLIHGVTGSGKTEIYMRLIEEAVARGRQAIMLVPEIALTPQACAAFARRFGASVTVTHSRLSLAERYDQWRKAYDGKVSVMIGPRSAIFTPFANLGAVIVDEEHERTYQSETSPKYHVKRVAEKLADLTGCLVVLGSATPAVGTYYEAQTGGIALCTLKERVNRRMPAVFVADMRAELADGNRAIFSRALADALAETLASRNQAILFLNRRGHSTFVSCRMCGYVAGCGQCSVNYTYHHYNDKMICHSCGAMERPPQTCPVCGSKHIRYFGVGTQKLEEAARAAFPAARVTRMDMDTTGRKNAHARIIHAFAAGEADILIGTQMVAKGLNFPNVALVGVVAADAALHTGDYRSAETAFQLITQVSGRAGRADVPGRVILQTYCPEHYSIAFAQTGDYAGFYEREIAIRRQMAYPPFTHIYMILATAAAEKPLIETLHQLMAILRRYNKNGQFEPLGPAPAILSKLRGVYRWKILIKCADEGKLRAYARFCIEKLKAAMGTDFITWNLTLDPMTIQ